MAERVIPAAEIAAAISSIGAGAAASSSSRSRRSLGVVGVGAVDSWWLILQVVEAGHGRCQQGP